MSRKQKRYSKQFKLDAVAYANEHPHLSCNTIASNLGISAITLGKWVKKAEKGVDIHRGSGN
ncbi:MAG: transposase [Firmicutes bacterium]|jgi:transposase|nr:transposase [Bacillota bacterium]